MNITKIMCQVRDILFNPKRYFQTSVLLSKKSKLCHKIAPYSWLDDKYWIEYYFYKIFGYKLDLNTPKTYDEKIQWMKLYYRHPLYTQLADKNLVRHYVKERIGSQHLVPLLGIYDKYEQITWKSLPDKFVIKMNHGCGFNIFCEEKRKIDQETVTLRIRDWSTENFYKNFREWQYKNIKPKIIIEEYLEGDKYLGLMDYKVFCFNGEPKFVEVISDRYKDKHLDIYNSDWVKQPYSLIGFKMNSESFDRPKYLDEMLFLAEKLSENLPFCRVDFYNFNNRIFFGEITFTPSAGFAKFTKPAINQTWGDMINLPKKYINLLL